MSTTVPLTTVYANTRNGTATYVQSDGTIVTQSALLTRTDHWISGQRGRLFEPSRTNLLTYSEGLSNAAWTKDNGLTFGTPDTSIGVSLDLVSNTSGTNFRAITQSFGSVADGATVTMSAYIKAGTSTETAIRIDDASAANRCTVPITWTAGVPSLQADMTAGITFVDADVVEVASGVYRVHLTVTNGTGGAVTLRARCFVQWDDAAAAVNTYVGGVQAETGAFPTTYIPTTTTAVTRLADRASCSLSSIGFRQGEGVIAIEGRAYYNAAGSGFPRIFQIDDGTANNTINLIVDETAGTLALVIVVGGVTQATEGLAYTSGSYFSIAIRYKLNDSVLSLGGSDSGADTACTIPMSLATLNWQTSQTGGSNGAAVFITKFATYAKEFADATLNAETA